MNSNLAVVDRFDLETACSGLSFLAADRPERVTVGAGLRYCLRYQHWARV